MCAIAQMDFESIILALQRFLNYGFDCYTKCDDRIEHVLAASMFLAHAPEFTGPANRCAFESTPRRSGLTSSQVVTVAANTHLVKGVH